MPGVVEVFLSESKIEVEKLEELLLHKIDFGGAEAEVVTRSLHVSIPGPMLVLGGDIVNVFRGEDEAGEENAVRGTPETPRHGLKLVL